MKPKFLFFDLDGTIIHSENLWDNVISHLVGRRNICHFRNCRKRYGGGGIEIQTKVLNDEFYFKLNDEQTLNLFKETCSHVFEKNEIRFVEGFLNVVEQSKLNNIGLALVTNSPNYGLDVLRKKLDLDSIFSGNIFNSDMAGFTFKPNPAINILALNTLRLYSSDVIMFEDSEEGFLASKNAQIKCIGVNTSGNLSIEYGFSSIINNFNEIDIANIEV